MSGDKNFSTAMILSKRDHMATAAAATPNFISLQSKVLVASADPGFRNSIVNSARYADSLCAEAEGGAHALAILKTTDCSNVLLDLNLPDLDSTELARIIVQRYPQIEVGFIDSHGGSAQVAELNEFGQRGETFRSRPSEVSVGLANKEYFVGFEEPLAGMIGASGAMQTVYRLARMVAKRDTAVLITGETGTGKELVAEAIHKMSARARQPFVVINCAAIPEALFEAELFGHARGAFTGANQSRLGRIHMAQRGTLFLDEIGELPLSMQAKLLRFLQDGEVQRLGSSDVYRVDVRVVAATNVRLSELVHAKQFREDLFYRLAVFPIAVPPLRDRLEDIEGLAGHFLKNLCSEIDVPAKSLTATALEYLQRSAWAGNIRELQHVIERAFILSGNVSHISPEYFSDRPGIREI
jgi:DNA-binding NtrC family response regulator